MKKEKKMLSGKSLIRRISVVAGLCVILFTVGLVFAQDGVPPAEVPSAENPLPDGWVDVLPSFDIIWKSFQSAWYVGAALILFLLVAFLRGKLRLAGWVVKIPKLSNWFEGAGSKVKFWLIIGFVGVGMALTSLTSVVNWTATEIIKNLLSGLAGGVVIALASMGVKAARDVHKDPKHPTKGQLKKKKKKNG